MARIAKCKWGPAIFYAVPIPNADTVNGMTKMRALTKGPRFDRGSAIHVRHSEIVEWVDSAPGVPAEKTPEIPDAPTF